MAESPIVFTVFVILILAGDSSARDLRPADHGLIFQTLSPTGTHSSPEMRSFFNSDNSSPTVSSSSEVAMPKAITSSNTAPPSWLSVSGDGSSDRVWNALKVASLACGVAGAILILVSGLIYVFKCRKQDQQNAAFSGNNGKLENDDDNNKLQLVVRDPSS